MKFTKVEFQSIQNSPTFQIDEDTCLTDTNEAMLNKSILKTTIENGFSFYRMRRLRSGTDRRWLRNSDGK